MLMEYRSSDAKVKDLLDFQFPQVLGHRTIIVDSVAKGFGASGGMVMLGTADQEALFRRYHSLRVFGATQSGGAWCGAWLM